MTTVITDLAQAGLKDLFAQMGEPPYRVAQLRKWLYKGLAASYDEMTDFPQALRSRLGVETCLHSLIPAHELMGADGTVKVLFTLADGRTIESALMSSGGRYTVCLSSQVGCPVGCPFCATGGQGFERNLSPGEMIDQVLYFARRLKASGENITNLVFMGMGEPLANYANLWRAIEELNAPDGFGLGARSMTISTAGMVSQIKRLAGEKLQVGLAVSLHAAENKLRDRLVPLNRKYPLEMLMPACRDYVAASGRRISFEYILFKGVNDSVPQAKLLAGLLAGMNCHVNLITANKTDNSAFRAPSGKDITAFEQELRRSGVNCTLRRSKGQDIDAGCGQLRSRFLSPACTTCPDLAD